MTVLHVLDQNETLVETLENKSGFDAIYWEDLHHRALKDNVETYEFTTVDTPANRAAPYLVGKNKLVVTDHRGNQFLFIIERSERVSENGQRVRRVEAYGDHYRLRTSGVIEPTTLAASTLIEAARFVLKNTEWQVGITEYSGVRTVTFDEYMNPLKALHHLRSVFDIELRFRVEFDGNRIIGKYVDFLHPLEIFDGKEIVYSKDMVGIRREETTDEVYTSIVGVGPADEDGNFLTFESINNGKNYIEDKEAVQRWGRHWYVYTPETEDQDMSAERLLSLTRTKLRKHIESIVKYEVRAVALDRIPWLEHENIELGYQVRIKDEEFNPALYLTARVIEEKRSYTDPTRDEFVFGNYVEHELSPNKMITDIQKLLFRRAGRWDASTRTIKSDVPPQDKTALWIDISQFPNVPKTWDEDAREWVKASPTEAEEVGAETPQGAQQKADQAEQNAKDHADTVAEQAKQEAIDYSEDFVVNYAQKQITSGSTPPANPEIGDLWFDNSTQPPTFRRWNGSEWEKLSATTFEELEGMIDKSQLPDRVIDSMKLAIDAVQEENLSEDSVYAEAIQAEAVGAQAIAANAILAKHIAAGEVTANHLAAEAVTADAIAAGAILAEHISANSINSSKIATEGLDANVIKTGVLDADLVAVRSSNSGTYIDSDGILVDSGSFRLRDEITQVESMVRENANMINDHSFEMIPRGDTAYPNARFNIDTQKLGNNYFWWNLAGGANFARIQSTYGTDDVKRAKFGLQAAVLLDSSITYWYQYVELNQERGTDGPYTISCYFSAFEDTSIPTTCEVVLQAYDYDFNWLDDVTRASTVVYPNEPYVWKRVYATARNLPSNTFYLRVRLNSRNTDTMALADGVQLVPFDRPIVYEAEEGIWKTLRSGAGYQFTHLVADFITANGGNIKTTAHEPLSLINGWTNYSTSFAGAAYSKSADSFVHLRGLIKSGTIGASCAVLPGGCRPYRTEIFKVATYGGNNGIVYVYPDGKVQVIDGHTSWVSLSGIVFLAEN